MAAPEWLVDSLEGGIMADGTVMALDNGNGHADPSMGALLNAHGAYDAAVAVGIDAERFLLDFSGDVNNYNDPRHVDWWYEGAALAVLNDLTAAVTMGGLEGDHNTLELIQGAATQAAFDGDGARVRDILDSAGGDTSALSDSQLVEVWGANSHYYNHNALKVHADDGSNLGFKLTHLRSLNDHALDGTEPGTRGGYNDRGEYPERPGTDDDGFYDYGRAFLDEMAYVLPQGFEADGSLAARNGGEVVTGGTPSAPEGGDQGEPEPQEPSAPEEPATEDSLVFEFDVRQDWGSGAVVDLKITNTGDAGVSDWAVAFDMAPGIGEDWNVDLQQLGDGRVAASDAGDGWTIAAGQTATWAGFVVEQGGLDEAALNAAADFEML